MPETKEPKVRACCLISELLEEAGIDRERARALRRQLLEGVILMCQWQLERMAETDRRRREQGGARSAHRRPRRVAVE